MQLEATEPEVDDVIVIESNINRTSSVSFKLTNQFNSYAPFEAFFTPDSSHEFSVFPTTGTLEPCVVVGRGGRGGAIDRRPVFSHPPSPPIALRRYGTDGTAFIVSFTPSTFPPDPKPTAAWSSERTRAPLPAA